MRRTLRNAISLGGFLTAIGSMFGPVAGQQAPDSLGIREIPGWGTLIDPSETAEVQSGGFPSVLALSIAADSNRTSVRDPMGDAPRVLRPVAGDFAVQVRMSWMGATAYEWPSIRTGVGPALLLYARDDRYFGVFLNYDTFAAATNEPPYRLWTKARGVQGGDWWTEVEGPDVWIRLERVGHSIRSYFGYDGLSWISLRTVEVPLPDSLHLAFLVRNSTGSRMQGVFRSLAFDQSWLPESTLLEDPYRARLRRETWLMYLPLALGGLGLSALVGFFALGVRAYRRSSGYGTVASKMTWGEHGVAYAMAFSSTFSLAASAFWVESSGGYMGSVIARFVLILAAPLVAIFSLAWIPLGSWYAAYLAEARQASQTPPRAIVILGVGICSVAGFIGFWAAEMNLTGGLIGFASAAAGGLAFLFLSFWYSHR